MIAEAFKGWVGETQALAVFAVGISWRRSSAERPMFPPNLAAHLHLHVHSPRLAHPDQAPYATNLASTNAFLAWVNTSLAWVNVNQAWSVVFETWANTLQPRTLGPKPRSRRTKPGSWQMSRSSTVR